MNFFLSTTGKSLTLASRTQNEQWSVETLLEGEEVTCLAADPFQAGVVYAGTQSKGVLRSANYGKTWLGRGLSGRTVKAISASRIYPGRLYAGTKPAYLFISQDHGERWEELPSFRNIFSRYFWLSPAELPFSAYVQGIALSPTDPNLIIAGIEAGAVVRSQDGGKSWEDHRKGALRDCHSITFHVSNGDWVYEGGGTGAGVAVSRDQGKTWTQPRTGLDRHYGWACAADPVQPQACYISVSPSPYNAHSSKNALAKIFRANPNGEWQELGGGMLPLANYMPYALMTDPTEPNHIYTGLSNGDVWHSQDQGDSWVQMPFNLKSVNRSMIMFA